MNLRLPPSFPLHPQPDGFHGHIFPRRSSRSLDAAGSVAAAVLHLRLRRRDLRFSSGPCLSGGDGTVSESPVSQPLGGTDLSHWLRQVRAASVHACHPCGLQPQTHHGVEFFAGLSWFPLLSAACRICTHNNKH